MNSEEGRLRMKTRRLTIWLALAFVGSVLLTGCGRGDRPELGYVTGQVTMDGEPLGNIIVKMKPEKGREAAVRADDNGNYDMEYLPGVKGTKVGPNTVTFEWPLGYEGPTKAIPRKYTGIDSPLKIDVKPGRNVFNFDLESDPNAPKTSGPVPD
jgi:hypothetical protein